MGFNSSWPMEIMLNSPNFFSCPARTAASTRRRGWCEWSWCRRWWSLTRGQSGASRWNHPTTSTWGRLVRRGRHICHDLFHLHRPGSERPSSILSPRRRRNSTSPRHIAHIRYLPFYNKSHCFQLGHMSILWTVWWITTVITPRCL